MVFVQGAEVKPARSANELMTLFEEGSKSRHTASTSKFRQKKLSFFLELILSSCQFVKAVKNKITLEMQNTCVSLLSYFVFSHLFVVCSTSMNC